MTSAYGRLGLPAEHAGQQRRGPRAGDDEPAEVHRLAPGRVEPAGLVRGVDRRRHEPGGDEHEHGAGEAEEARVVELQPAAVDQRADEDAAHAMPSTAPMPAGGRVVGALEDGEQEDDGLEALADDGEERHRRRAPSPSPRRAPRRRSARSSPDRLRACLRIQTTMNVTMPTAAAPMTVSSISCWRCGQVLVEDLQRDADDDADRDRRADADPHQAQRVAAALLVEERGDDADDQRGLDALAQADDERGKHV